MKYDIIKTENYLIIVDDSAIKKGDWTYHPIKGIYVAVVDGAYTNQKKIIAHLPINGSSILEGVNLLPTIEDDTERLSTSEFPHLYQPIKGLDTTLLLREGYEIGYTKAKDKYKYTEDDLRKMFSMAWQIRERYEGSDKHGWEDSYPENWKDMDYEERQEWFFEQELNSLIKYPIGFECELRTKFEWVGKYIY